MGPNAPNILKSDLITGSLGILKWRVKTLLNPAFFNIYQSKKGRNS